MYATGSIEGSALAVRQGSSASMSAMWEIKNFADQKMRKLINAITKRGTLNNFTSAKIEVAAAGENFQIAVASSSFCP
jgi:hypothetical protein